jgi:hypothetical protein
MTLSPWVRDTRERVVSTASGSVLTAWAVSQDWRIILTFGGLMTVYTLLKCVAARGVGTHGTASMSDVVEYDARAAP